jgi:hypothetical protein
MALHRLLGSGTKQQSAAVHARGASFASRQTCVAAGFSYCDCGTSYSHRTRAHVFIVAWAPLAASSNSIARRATARTLSR